MTHSANPGGDSSSSGLMLRGAFPPDLNPFATEPWPRAGAGPIGMVYSFAREMAGRALLGGLLVPIIYIPYGVVFLIVTWDWSVFFLPIVAGVIIGILMGAGWTVVAWFSNPHFRAEPKTDGHWRFYLGSSGWIDLISVVIRVFTHDYSQGESGRWKRAILGAVVLCLIFSILVVTAALTSRYPGPAPHEYALMYAVVALIGAVIGALSDSL